MCVYNCTNHVLIERFCFSVNTFAATCVISHAIYGQCSSNKCGAILSAYGSLTGVKVYNYMVDLVNAQDHRQWHIGTLFNIIAGSVNPDAQVDLQLHCTHILHLLYKDGNKSLPVQRPSYIM